MGKLKDLFVKLKQVKHLEIIAGIVILAVVLVIYFSCVSCSTKDAPDEQTADLGDLDYCASMQIQLEKIVSEISGVGDASVVINWDRSVSVSFGGGTSENPKATGVIVVCDGGNSTKVKLDVTFAVSTLLDLSIEKIMVYPKS